MLAPTLLATFAAVLAGNQVVVVNADDRTVARHVRLPGTGASLFAAPDGSLVVPLANEDSTVVIAADGRPGRWQGRVFPLFFDEFDRMYAITGDALVTMAFPQRVQIGRLPLPGQGGVFRAVVSRNGLVVAMLGAPPRRRELAIVVARGESRLERVPLDSVPSALTMDPAGGWVLVGCVDGRVELLAGGEMLTRSSRDLAGEIVGLAAAADGRAAVAAVAANAGGLLAGLRVRPHSRAPLKEVFATQLPWRPVAVAMQDDTVAVTGDSGVVFLARGGRRVLGMTALPGAQAVVFLPDDPVSAQPTWSDQPRR